ncbi:uncharacterized protein LOC117022125 [Rhinolophus ferrumequinum]|uniref:uncharacterized protein LOC117022125 n=1 Tax=Rhinolophus ferrumequinum TaxID=59479 RepID=UPI00140FC324|nr:uncharacterized protein LOC117022125 [Rhinolophus ferrumequinum]
MPTQEDSFPGTCSDRPQGPGEGGPSRHHSTALGPAEGSPACHLTLIILEPHASNFKDELCAARWHHPRGRDSGAQLTCAGAQGTSGVGVLVPAPPLGAPGGGTLIPVRLCAAESLDAARGRSWGVGCEGHEPGQTLAVFQRSPPGPSLLGRLAHLPQAPGERAAQLAGAWRGLQHGNGHSEHPPDPGSLLELTCRKSLQEEQLDAPAQVISLPRAEPQQQDSLSPKAGHREFHADSIQYENGYGHINIRGP